MSGVTKLTVIFDENSHKIAIFSICAPKRHPFTVTSLIERPTKAEVRRRNIKDTTVSCSGCPKMSDSVYNALGSVLFALLKYYRNSKLLILNGRLVQEMRFHVI